MKEEVTEAKHYKVLLCDVNIWKRVIFYQLNNEENNVITSKVIPLFSVWHLGKYLSQCIWQKYSLILFNGWIILSFLSF